MKTSDKTIYKNMSLCSFGNGANLTAVDSKDGQLFVCVRCTTTSITPKRI